MTAQQIFTDTMALLATPESDSGDYRRFAAASLSVVLAEVFDVNNSVRAKRGKPLLDEPQRIGSLEDEVEIEPLVVNRALLYGLASRLIADDDLQRAVYFHNLFAAGLSDCMKTVASGIIDVYRGAV